MMKQRNETLSLAALVGFLALALSACVTNPYNDQWVDPAAVDFAGYAEHSGATVQIQALDKRSNSWVTIRTVTASTTPTNYGGETLYSWEAVDTNTQGSGHCVWGDPAWTSCPVPAGSADAKFRVREVGGRLFTSFESDGVACVLDEVGSGENWFVAGYDCKSSETPVLTLHWLS